MTWTTDENDDLINLDHIHHIFINDRGKDYKEPFEIKAFSTEYEFILARFEKESQAREFIETLHSDLESTGEK